MSWLTVEDPRLADLWPAGLDLDTPALAALLASAADQCAAFAPAPALDATGLAIIPDRWAVAQAMQARALAQAGYATQGDQLGGYGERVTVWPMDWTVKALLRPKRGRPVIA